MGVATMQDKRDKILKINIFDYEYLKDYLEYNKIKQVYFAKKININDKTLRAWLYGVYEPSLHHVAIIANALNCTIDELCKEIE